LSAAFDIIGAMPHIGRPYRQSPVPDARRVLLKGTRYHVCYAPRADELIVLAVWHARRGTGPPFRVS
jgi:plasmid stabilization system protein ParE